MLAVEHPDHVLYRHPEPLLEPGSTYERTGAVKDIVFVSGAVEKDATYYLYYGGADRFPAARRPLPWGRWRGRSLLSSCSPGCEKRASGRREEALALRTRTRAVGQARQARTESVAARVA
jgi:hypothetical protein